MSIKRLRVTLGVLLTAADVLASFFLIFGGRLIAAERSALGGYATAAIGLMLVYLSVGVWKMVRWKQIARIGFYSVLFCLVLMAAILETVRPDPYGGPRLFIGLSLFSLTVAIISIAHLGQCSKELKS